METKTRKHTNEQSRKFNTGTTLTYCNVSSGKSFKGYRSLSVCKAMSTAICEPMKRRLTFSENINRTDLPVILQTCLSGPNRLPSMIISALEICFRDLMLRPCRPMTKPHISLGISNVKTTFPHWSCKKGSARPLSVEDYKKNENRTYEQTSYRS